MWNLGIGVPLQFGTTWHMCPIFSSKNHSTLVYIYIIPLWTKQTNYSNIREKERVQFTVRTLLYVILIYQRGCFSTHHRKNYFMFNELIFITLKIIQNVNFFIQFFWQCGEEEESCLFIVTIRERLFCSLSFMPVIWRDDKWRLTQWRNANFDWRVYTIENFYGSIHSLKK